MTPVPILDAELMTATAIRNALAPIAGVFNTRPKVYWQQAEQGADYPRLIAQAQTPFKVKAYIGMLQAVGVIVVKSQATDAKSARDHLALAAPRMASLSFPDVTIRAEYTSSLILPPTASGVFQSAHTYRITITKE